MPTSSVDLRIPAPSNLPPEIVQNRVLNYREAAAFLGISPATFERLIYGGDGPPLVVLSERRRGVRLRDLIDWIEARREAAAPAPRS